MPGGTVLELKNNKIKLSQMLKCNYLINYYRNASTLRQTDEILLLCKN